MLNSHKTLEDARPRKIVAVGRSKNVSIPYRTPVSKVSKKSIKPSKKASYRSHKSKDSNNFSHLWDWKYGKKTLSSVISSKIESQNLSCKLSLSSSSLHSLNKWLDEKPSPKNKNQSKLTKSNTKENLEEWL